MMIYPAMTPAPEKEYIITEEEMRGIFVYLKNSGLHVQAMPINMIFDKVRSHPYTSALIDVLEEFVKRIIERKEKSNYGNAPYDFIYASDVESYLELFQEELRAQQQKGEP